jgi:hypothetical protein
MGQIYAEEHKSPNKNKDMEVFYLDRRVYRAEK